MERQRRRRIDIGNTLNKKRKDTVVRREGESCVKFKSSCSFRIGRIE